MELDHFHADSKNILNFFPPCPNFEKYNMVAQYFSQVFENIRFEFRVLYWYLNHSSIGIFDNLLAHPDGRYIHPRSMRYVTKLDYGGRFLKASHEIKLHRLRHLRLIYESFPFVLIMNSQKVYDNLSKILQLRTAALMPLLFAISERSCCLLLSFQFPWIYVTVLIHIYVFHFHLDDSR